MKKLLTIKTAKKLKRNELIKSDFEKLFNAGSMKQAIYEDLAHKYDVSVTTVLRVSK